MKWFIYTLKNTFNYQGRARRAELGWFMLMNFLIQIGAVLLVFLFLWATGDTWLAEKLNPNTSYIYDEVSAIGLFFDLYEKIFPVLFSYQIVMWIVSLSLVCRRMHDLGWSGWWQLLLFYVLPIVLWIMGVLFALGAAAEFVGYLVIFGGLAYSGVFLIVNGFLFFHEGERKTNKYGPDPKAVETGATGAEEK